MDPGCLYHVYNRANAFDKLFYNEDNYRFFIEKVNKYLPEVCSVYAFALLPNHFHLLVKIHQGARNARRISQVFSNLFNAYTKSYNKYYRRRGTLFSRHFKCRLVDDLHYQRSCVLYLHHNAIHHGIPHELGEWRFTSHAKYICPEDEDLNTIEALVWFGGVDGYIEACKKYRIPKAGEFYFD